MTTDTCGEPAFLVKSELHVEAITTCMPLQTDALITILGNRSRGRSSGVARGGFGGFNPLPIEKCQKISEDKIAENTQS